MATRKSSIPSNDFTDAEIDEIFALPPIFDQKVMMDIESAAANIQQFRRVSLGVLTRSMPELLEVAHEDATVYGDMLCAAAGFKHHVEGLLELATAALLRLELADERPEVMA